MDRKELEKTMGIKDYFFLAFGIYGGAAWITTLGGWLKYGPIASILGFVICGLILIPIGLVYGDLTSKMPLAGGEIAFSYKAFGPFIGTMTGWFLALAYIIVCPYEAISVSLVIEYMSPSFKVLPLYTIKGYTIYLPSLIVGTSFSILFTYLNYKGVRFRKIFQTVVSTTIIVLVIVFLILSIHKGNMDNVRPYFALDENNFISIFKVLSMAPFFLAGFDAIPLAAEEAKDNRSIKKIRAIIILAIAVGVLFYCVTTLATSLINPWQETVNSSMPTLYAFTNAFGSKFKNLVMFCAILGLLSTWNGCFFAGTRILFAMGRGGLLPGKLGKVHPKYNTPYLAVLFTGFISILGPFIGKPGLIPAVNIGALAFVITWLSISLSAIKLGKKNLFIKKIATFVCLFILSIILIPYFPSSLSWPTEWIFLGAWISIGMGIYFFIANKYRKMSKEEQDYQILGKYNR